MRLRELTHLSRFLYVYVNKAPNKDLTPLEREFVKLVMSKIGQEVVVKTVIFHYLQQ